MPNINLTITPEDLEMSLLGYGSVATRHQQRIAEIRSALAAMPRQNAAPKAAQPANTPPAALPTPQAGPMPVKRNLSPAVRKRMAEAQKKRWAAVKTKEANGKGGKKVAAAGA